MAGEALDNEQYSVAIDYFKEMVIEAQQENALQKHANLSFILAKAYDDNNQSDECMKTLIDALKKYPDHIDILKMFFEKYADEEKYDEILAVADEILSKTPKTQNEDMVLFMKARTLMILGRFLEAEPIYDSIKKTDPKNKYAIMDLGYYCMSHASSLVEQIAEMSDENNEKAELTKQAIAYSNKAVTNMMKAYELFVKAEKSGEQDLKRDMKSTLVFLEEAASILNELGEDVRFVQRWAKKNVKRELYD